MRETKLHAGLMARSMGMSVIPFHRNKRPAFARGQIQPYRARSATVAQLKTWFADDDRYEVGIITGAVSQRIVVDVDPRNGGDQSVKGLPMPPTPTVLTHDGYHAHFRHDGGLKTKRDALPGVDLLCESWQVMIPPSLHPSGTRYAWHDMLQLTNTDFAPPPTWVLDLLRSSTTTPKASHTALTKKTKILEDGRARVVLDTCPTPKPLTPKEVRGLFADVDANRAVADFLGLPDLGDNALCLWHPDSRPSMSLFADARTGAWKVHDHHVEGEGEFFGLADVFASQLLGRAVRFTRKPTLTAWWLRALLACKFLEPADVAMKPLPDDVRPSVRTVYDGFLLLLQAKWRYDPGKPTQFAVRFAMDWCGIDAKDTVEAALWWLVRHGYIRRAGRDGKAWLYLPGASQCAAVHQEVSP
jgi:hypothetical protein